MRFKVIGRARGGYIKDAIIVSPGITVGVWALNLRWMGLGLRKLCVGS